MFQITESTEARLASLTSRIEKHGDDEVPAVSLGIEIDESNTLLDTIDPTIRHALFKAKPDATPELPGVEPSTPILRCNSIETVKLTTKHEGWTLSIDGAVDSDAAMNFGSCKVDKFSVEPRQGGSITLRLRIGTSDLDAERHGYLGMHVGQSIWITLRAPEKPAAGATEATGAEIDGTVGHPGAAAADGQASLLDGDAAGSDGAGDGLGGFDDDMGRGDASITEDGGAGAGEPQRGENWPFPTGAADGSSDMERSAKARNAAELEQAELEAGMRSSIDKAGVSPKGARRARKAVAGAVE